MSLKKYPPGCHSKNICCEVTKKYPPSHLSKILPWHHSKHIRCECNKKISVVTSLKTYPLWRHSKNICYDVTQKISVSAMKSLKKYLLCRHSKDIRCDLCQKFSRDVTQNVSAVSVTKKYPPWCHSKHIHRDVTQKYPPWCHLKMFAVTSLVLRMCCNMLLCHS